MENIKFNYKIVYKTTNFNVKTFQTFPQLKLYYYYFREYMLELEIKT